MPDFLRYRQIHHDFQNSDRLTNIGGEFNTNAWAQQLADAHGDSITSFARAAITAKSSTTRRPTRSGPTIHWRIP